MTALSIIQDALREIGATNEVPTTLAGTDPNALQSLALLNRALQEVVERMEWPGLLKEANFTVVNGQEEYDFESDYAEPISITMWDRTNTRRVWGPVTPADWQALKGRSITSTIRKRFRIRKAASSNAVKILIFPLPGNSTDQIFYEYVMDTPAISAGGAFQAQFLVDTDTSVEGLPERLFLLTFKWMWKESKGLPYAEMMASAERSIDRAKASAGSRNIWSMDRQLDVHRFQLPDGNFG